MTEFRFYRIFRPVEGFVPRFIRDCEHTSEVARLRGLSCLQATPKPSTMARVLVRYCSMIDSQKLRWMILRAVPREHPGGRLCSTVI